MRITVEDNDRQVKDGLILLTNLLMSREKLWCNQMADEDKKKVEMETQQVVTNNINYILLGERNFLYYLQMLLKGDEEKEGKEDKGPQCTKKSLVGFLLVFK